MTKQEAAAKRVAAVRAYMAEHDVDCTLITSYENRRYLTFLNSDNGYVFITQNDFVLLTDRRYFEQARIETEGVCRLIEQTKGRIATTAEF